MKNRGLIIGLLCVAVAHFAQGQTSDLQKYNEVKYSLVGDTLFTNKDFRIYLGQQLFVGKSSAEDGWYHTITFKNPAAYPLVLWRNMELKLDPDYQFDEELRIKDKLKEYLHQGESLEVNKIKKRGNKRYGYSYVVFLKQGSGITAINYSCFIMDALKVGEIVLEKE